MSDTKYVDPGFVTAFTVTEQPAVRSVIDYARKSPTRWIAHCQDGRQRRVYALCFSNAASFYIVVKNEHRYIGIDMLH